LTVLIPGIVATAPWLLFLVQHTPATLGFDKNATIANALLFAAVAVVGAVCEGLGSHLESKWDERLESKYSVLEHWYRYLNHSGSPEPVAFRYLSRLVTTMYFELSMFFAVPSFVAGSCVLAILRFPEHKCTIALSGVVLLPLLMWYFHMQAKNTHEGMCKIRMNLKSAVAAPTLPAAS
jgi:hypothetical protein